MWNTGSSQATTKAKKPTGCHSVLTMDMYGFIKAHTAHNHPPNPAEVETAIEAAKTFGTSDEMIVVAHNSILTWVSVIFYMM